MVNNTRNCYNLEEITLIKKNGDLDPDFTYENMTDNIRAIKLVRCNKNQELIRNDHVYSPLNIDIKLKHLNQLTLTLILQEKNFHFYEFMRVASFHPGITIKAYIHTLDRSIDEIDEILHFG